MENAKACKEKEAEILSIEEYADTLLSFANKEGQLFSYLSAREGWDDSEEGADSE